MQKETEKQMEMEICVNQQLSFVLPNVQYLKQKLEYIFVSVWTIFYNNSWEVKKISQNKHVWLLRNKIEIEKYCATYRKQNKFVLQISY